MRKYKARRRNIQLYYSFDRLLTLIEMVLEKQTNGVSRKTVGGCFKSKQLALELYRGSGRAQQDARRIRRGFRTEIGTKDLYSSFIPSSWARNHSAR